MPCLLTYGRKLFTQGASIDELIDQTVDELANRRAARELLETGENENDIGFRRLTGAQKEIASQIANLIDRLKYLTGRRNRLLETLVAQQNRLDDFVNNGVDKPQKSHFTGKLPDPVKFWHGLSDFEMSQLVSIGPDQDQDQEDQRLGRPIPQEPEAEMEVSHYSSNLSEEGICAPGDCRCTDKKCEDFNYTN